MKKIVNNIKKYFAKPEGLEDTYAPKDVNAKFLLMYKNTAVGELTLNDAMWEFKYTPMFKTQKEVLPIVDFPDVNKVYKLDHLWPFFVSRIPGLGQPEVQNVIKREKIDKENEFELLKRFGIKSIANPFTLELSIS